MKRLFFIQLVLFILSCNKSNESISPVFSEDNSNKQVTEYKVVDLPNNFFDPIHEENLNVVKSKIVGTWFGKVETPWTDPYHIVFKLTDSNVYSCYNITNNGYNAFYYGSDQDSSIKQFKIKNILSDGSAEGEMIQLFTSRTTNIDFIKDLRFYNDYRNLSFVIWHGSNRNPIKVYLYKLGPN